MNIYLRVLNPVFAITVLLLCIWAAITEEGGPSIYGLVAGGLPTYFFAKGIFSASAVFLLGKILQEMITHRDTSGHEKAFKSDLKYMIVWLCVIIGLLVGLFLLSSTEEVEYVWVDSPDEIKIVDDHIVPEADVITIAGLIRNKSEIVWRDHDIKADVFIDGVYAGTCSNYFDGIGADKEEYFTVDCDQLKTKKLLGKITYQLKYRGEKIKD